MEQSVTEKRGIGFWQSEAKRYLEAVQNVKSCVTLYDKFNLDELTEQYSDQTFPIDLHYIDMVRNGPKYYIDNIAGEVFLLKIGERVLPILVAENNYTNSYVCSPHAHYISLALESLHLFENRWVRQGIKTWLKLFGSLLKKGDINRVVYVNHSFFSTDIQPNDLSQEEIEHIVELLKQRFPQHAIAFRSINQKTCPALLTSLRNVGFSLIMSKYSYFTNPQDDSLFQTRIIKSDLKVWNESEYKIIDNLEIVGNYEEVVLKLYESLSIDDHSAYNPRINKQFLQLMLENSKLRFFALEKEGKIDGVMGYVEQDNILMCPFFGYDKRHPDRNRVYRLMSTFLLLEAKSKKCLFHQSSGASFYKKIRRASGFQEYLAVFTKHLPKKQRSIWSLLAKMINSSAQSIMKKY